MKKLLTIALTLLLLPAMAQEVVVQGRITDQSTGEPLPGATIQIEGTTVGSVTDLDGRFTLRLPQDVTTTLEVNYLGYEAFTFTANPSESNYYDISLTDLEVSLKEVVVIGRLQGQQKALNQQLNAGNIKNVVAADQIGRFPDPNVAEAL
ncbi:MAG TPA: TonB-dependent receptor, partial [Cytophagales bacterium]|nr:TonB-dependent receptor [Cytophagales bacterium]